MSLLGMMLPPNENCCPEVRVRSPQGVGPAWNRCRSGETKTTYPMKFDFENPDAINLEGLGYRRPIRREQPVEKKEKGVSAVIRRRGPMSLRD